jgi:hypothetical protein
LGETESCKEVGGKSRRIMKETKACKQMQKLRRDLLTHGAEPFLRSRELFSHSRTSQHFIEPED